MAVSPADQGFLTATVQEEQGLRGTKCFLCDEAQSTAFVLVHWKTKCLKPQHSLLARRHINLPLSIGWCCASQCLPSSGCNKRLCCKTQYHRLWRGGQSDCIGDWRWIFFHQV